MKEHASQASDNDYFLTEIAAEGWSTTADKAITW